MKNGIITTIDWKLIGATMASADSEDQAHFFNAFVHEVKTWPTEYQIGLQFAHIREHLTPDAAGLLSEHFSESNNQL